MHTILKLTGVAVLVTVASCLVLPQKGSERVIGGTPATEGEFPHHVILWGNVSTANMSRDPECGGSLVSVDGYQFVLTSIFCTQRIIAPRSMSVYAGITDRDKANTNGNFQRRQGVKAIRHEGYHYSGRVHDIAIVLLNEPFEINEFVAPIPLPKQGQATLGNVVATGFGITQLGATVGPRVLHKVELPVVADDVCQELLSEERISPYLLCTGDLEQGGIDWCTGDGGGPLMAVDGGYLAGISSWGEYPCGGAGIPSVNTEVAFYIDWIQFQLDNNVF